MTELQAPLLRQPPTYVQAGARGPQPLTTDNALDGAVDQRFCRDLVCSMRTAVMAIDRLGNITVMNDLAYRVLGLDPQVPTLGSHYADALQHQLQVARLFDGAFELGHLPNRAELRLEKCERVIGYTLSHVRDPQGRVIGAALLFKDLTRVEQIEERERLRDRLAAVGEMAAAIAHEVKNPLAGIKVMAGLLKRHLRGSDDAQSILDDIITEAEMANAIVREVLEFVRPLSLHVERVSIRRVLEDALAMAERQTPPGHVKVRWSIPHDPPPVTSDPHQLKQVFANLLINAFEALEGAGLVDISAWQVNHEDHGLGDHSIEARSLVIEVADNGPGLPPELLDRVFNPFFTTKPHGSGLGLPIVRKIVNAHDGRIDAVNRSGGGACFRVTLPLSEGEGWS